MDVQKAFLSINKYSNPGVPRSGTKAVVLHWVNNPGTSAKANRDYFEALSSPGERGAVFASAHYIVGIKGEVLQCMPENSLAFHCGSSQIDPGSGKIYTDLARERFGEAFIKHTSPNYLSIGIELCHPDSTGKFTPETEAIAAVLVADICRRYGLDNNLSVLRHWDVVGWKKCPLYWVKNPVEWEDFKKKVKSVVH